VAIASPLTLVRVYRRRQYLGAVIACESGQSSTRGRSIGTFVLPIDKAAAYWIVRFRGR
jgi:hypothetical protein